MNTHLGRLEKVSLRTVWSGEQTDFSPWLAQEDNLSLLADTIGLELELESTEKNVGPFRADIVCTDTATDTWVLIENQLERTDHNHLGQLMTYAAGLNAVSIVWIAERFTEEHRAALDWLNEITDNSVNFFGLEIELWRIADSPIAPKFNVISKPNDWTKTVAAARKENSGEITPVKQMQLEFWQGFIEELENHNSIIRVRKPRPQHWMNFSIGRSEFRMSADMNTRERRIGAQVTTLGPDAKPHFYLLQEDKEAIEAEFGRALVWREASKYGIIAIRNRELDPNDRTNWPAQHRWMRQTLERLHEVFAPRIKLLDAGDYIDQEDEDSLT
ncbi:MAG: DUF4268 domain-containing protein [Pseudomonadales bacterium]|nr:DUF4268 domain-containing protein [Pseudomonadales bacterium]